MLVTLLTGDIGAIGEPSTGRIAAVANGGQADLAGVLPGWFISEVNGEPYDVVLLKRCVQGNMPFTLRIEARTGPGNKDSNEAGQVQYRPLAACAEVSPKSVFPTFSKPKHQTPSKPEAHDMDAQLVPGCHVLIENLEMVPAFNGREGVILHPAAGKERRWAVQVSNACQG